jgi:CheY-like chemotaxis protein
VLSPGAGADVTVELRPKGLLRLRGKIAARIDRASAQQRGERPGYLVEIPSRVPPPLCPPEPPEPVAPPARALDEPAAPAPAAAPVRLRQPEAIDVILLVDDDRVLVRMMEVWLGRLGYRTCVARSLADAQARLADPGLRVRAAVVDALLPDGRGAPLIAALAAEGTAVPTLGISALTHTEDARRELQRAGARDFLAKPFGRDALLAAVRGLLRGVPMSVHPPTRTRHEPS